jgi:LuxR family transcriptional regulator, maltose regulon positive regulatory protein
MLHALAAPAVAPSPAVPRGRLSDRLVETGPRLVLLTAPAGCGKTTLLDEWERRDRRPFARLRLEPADNDPARLGERLARALDAVRAEPAFVLALDDVDVVRASGAFEAILAAGDEVGDGSRLALASRTRPDIPVARLRANRELLEIGARELVMTTLEAGALLARAQIDTTPAMVEDLVRRTEGFPAGLALAALALAGEKDPVAAAARFGGDDALVADYLRDEVLAGLPADTIAFLMRTSVLGVLSGPACDAVLDARGSARRLSAIGRRDLLLVALDRKDAAYRCHRLLRDMLRADLRRREPELEARLHARAAEYFEHAGDSERALHHAVEGRDLDRAARLARELAPACVAPRRDRGLYRRLAALSDAHPSLALAAGGHDFLRGDLCAVQRRLGTAERTSPDGPEAALLRAALCADGVARMGEDAARAAAREAPGSPWLPLCRLLEGVALHLTGERGAAERLLEDGVRRGAVAAPGVQTLCLAQLALLAAERDDWESASASVARATAQADHYGLGEHPATALVLAAEAMVCARRGRVAEARDAQRDALRLLARLVDFAPWHEAETRIALARAALRLSDVPASRELLAEAARHARRVPDAGVLAAWLSEVGAASAAGEAAALTPAELRILAFLPTHLSFREIAARLCVSGNTVKTQAHAIYRKLDAASRSEAVANAGELGLLDI